MNDLMQIVCAVSWSMAEQLAIEEIAAVPRPKRIAASVFKPKPTGETKPANRKTRRHAKAIARRLGGKP